MTRIRMEPGIWGLKVIRASSTGVLLYLSPCTHVQSAKPKVARQSFAWLVQGQQTSRRGRPTGLPLRDHTRMREHECATAAGFLVIETQAQVLTCNVR